ncbi:MAG: hypothetical protein WA786_01430 [Acidimicrobiales bacterium]
MTKVVAALLCAGLVLAACGNVSLSSATKSWITQSGFRQNLPTLTRDAQHSATELRDLHASANDLHTVCAVLDVDSLSANSSLPTPDSQATSLLSTAYDDLGAGANTCYNAATNPHARALALTMLARGMAALSEGTARLNVATGAAP